MCTEALCFVLIEASSVKLSFTISVALAAALEGEGSDAGQLAEGGADEQTEGSAYKRKAGAQLESRSGFSILSPFA